MEHIMYVFSATGNTLHISKLVKNNLPNHEIVVRPINEEYRINTDAKSADIVGIYYPCFYGSMPQLVKRFVSKLELNKKAFVYSVVTAGGNLGNCNRDLKETLQLNDIELSFGVGVLYSSNYMQGWYYKMILKSPEVIASKLDEFELQSEKIARMIENKEKNNINGSFMGKLPQIISPSYLIKDTRPYDREFSTGSNCNKCGLCAKVCPVKNIEMNEAPSFKHNCQRCMACIQYCPKQAFLINRKPMNKKRYVNPFVSVDEIISLHNGFDSNI